MSDKIATAIFNPKSIIFKNMLVKAYKEVGESLGYVLMIRGPNKKGTTITYLYGISDEDLSYNVLTELIVSVKIKTIKAFKAFIEDVSLYIERFVGDDESDTIPSSIEKIIYHFSRRRVNWDIDDLPSPEDM